MRSLLQVSGFGPFRDIVRHFEDDDYGTIVHHNLGLRITVLGVDDASTAALYGRRAAIQRSSSGCTQR